MMPYCKNCGERIESTWRHCGQCGTPVPDHIRESSGEQPRARGGFLSAQSAGYLDELRAGELDVDRDAADYTQLCREAHAAFRDFVRIGTVDELDISDLWLGPIDKEPGEFDLKTASLGVFYMLDLFDRLLGTDLVREFESEFRQTVKEIYEETEGLSWPPEDVDWEPPS